MSTIVIWKKCLFLSLTLLINNYGGWDLGHSAVVTGAGFGVYLLEFGQTRNVETRC